jgi:putative hydrolase of HD superfamily
MARRDQLENLPECPEFLEMLKELEAEKTKEAIIARDADYLECFIQAKEYYDIGYKEAKVWMKNTRKAMKTESAKKLADRAAKMSAHAWWAELMKLD